MAHKKRHYSSGEAPVRNAMNTEGRMYGHEMISEDHSAPCNLPRHIVDKEWPKAHNYHMHTMEDLFEGVQKQLHEDYKDLGREMSPKKY